MVVLLAILVPVLGSYMAKVYGDGPAPGDRVLLPAERLLYRVCRVDPDQEQRWTVYAFSVLAFSMVGAVILYVMQRVQTSLPLNPTHAPQVGEALSFNTAVSFLTNTNWQSYYPESTMSHLTQMAGLAVQNFASAAVGMAVAVALIRGIARRRADTLGNFWVDVTRSITRVLLPISFIVAIVYLSQGVVQNFHGFEVIRTLEGKLQVIPGGPAASQEAIKMLGTNGGGFWNANAAHPISNPNGITSVLGLVLIFLIPFALVYTYGKFIGSMRQAVVIGTVMVALIAITTAFAVGFETQRQREARSAGGRPVGDIHTSGRQPRGQGGPLRRTDLGRVGVRGHAYLERLGELDARQLHPARRDDAADQHEARRGESRRRGGRPQRDPHPRIDVGLHRRPDGGPYARVPRQEDRRRRREAGGASMPWRCRWPCSWVRGSRS